MAYRDLEGALVEERRMLAEEIERLDRERARFQSTLRRRDELAERLRELDHRLGSPAAEPSAFLEKLRLASPCSARWDDMVGDQRVRFCPSCAKNVYDLSSLTEEEIRELVVQTEGRFCGRLRKRRDGRALTSDCPVGLQRKRRLGLAATVLAAAGAAGGASLQAADTQPARSLLLVVKYVDRVGTQVEQRVGPSYEANEPGYIMGGFDRVPPRSCKLSDRRSRAKRSKSSRR